MRAVKVSKKVAREREQQIRSARDRAVAKRRREATAAHKAAHPEMYDSNLPYEPQALSLSRGAPPQLNTHHQTAREV